jgi:hypothetical protein
LELREDERDDVTAHSIRNRHTVIGELSEAELAEELLVAAMARDHRRIERFNELLAERARRARAL